MTDKNLDDNYYEFLINHNCLIKWSLRDLNVSKESSEVLSSRLKDKNLLGKDTNATFY